uniref:Protein 4.1 n=1 Tax=Denticeps clupeoides TaxID=299321 RepID=A0AAY4DQM0_9TELE
MRWRVTLLDNREKEWNLPTNATGQDLFDEVCECLNLLERDYYGLAIWDSQHTKTWLDVSRQIIRQVSGFVFSVKFYPPDPTKITEDITRYLLCLQLRKEILTGRLPCPSDTLPVLGSFILQSEFGQYDPDLLGDAYIRGLYLAPNQKSEDLQRMKELHQTYGSMSAAQADFLFLQNVKQLRMYGTDLHPAKDSDGEDVLLGVCSAGVVVYKEDEIENKFMWPRVLKLSYRRARFLIKTRPLQGDEWTTVFTLSSFRACKRLWKVCVEHHGFFRCRFRFHGHTEAESLRASADVTRPAPLFSRRARPNTGTVSVCDVCYLLKFAFAVGTVVTAGLESTYVPETEKDHSSLDYEHLMPDDQKGPFVFQNFDVTQDVVLQHHASIRELKRIFMEAVPEPQPSEWEQHLSIHTSFHLEMEFIPYIHCRSKVWTPQLCASCGDPNWSKFKESNTRNIFHICCMRRKGSLMKLNSFFFYLHGCFVQYRHH